MKSYFLSLLVLGVAINVSQAMWWGCQEDRRFFVPQNETTMDDQGCELEATSENAPNGTEGNFRMDDTFMNGIGAGNTFELCEIIQSKSYYVLPMTTTTTYKFVNGTVQPVLKVALEAGSEDDRMNRPFMTANMPQ
eukprot:maker-scaffold10_size831480-snap-gene-3.21 protein:Tk01813 transcript:maker-scaffold10_size831480-snap-gene-3.21-mRNA-1 annotation:"glycoside hydrolase family 12"